MLTIVIPAYNEEGRIEQTIKTLKGAFGDARIVVIFDGNDNTPDICQKYGVEVDVYKKRLGKGGAIREAIKYLRDCDIAILLDADMPVTANDINRGLGIMEGADLLSASRIYKNRVPPFRLFLHNSFQALSKFIFPEFKPFYDWQAGFKVFRAKSLKDVSDELIMSDFLIDTNILLAFLKRRFKVMEYPVIWEHTEEGSKVSTKLLRVLAIDFLSLIKLRFYYSPFRVVLRTGSYNRAQGFLQRILR